MAILVTTRSGKGSPLTQSEMDTNLTNLARSATESLEGNMEIADSTETAALTDLTKAVVPGHLQDGVDAALVAGSYNFVTAYGCFNGASGSTAWKREVGFNTVTRNSPGRYTITFDTTRADSSYTVVVTSSEPNTYSPSGCIVESKTTSGFQVQVWETSGGSTRQTNDADDINVIVYG